MLFWKKSKKFVSNFIALVRAAQAALFLVNHFVNYSLLSFEKALKGFLRMSGKKE
jgi:hypothetical protein